MQVAERQQGEAGARLAALRLGAGVVDDQEDRREAARGAHLPRRRVEQEQRQLSSAGWSIDSGSAVCAIVGNCVQDTSGDYEASQDCVFTFSGSAQLVRAEWGLEGYSSCNYDYLQVNGGTKYCGSTTDSTALPSAYSVTGVTSFIFHSDSSAQGVGFKICAPTPAPILGPQGHCKPAQAWPTHWASSCCCMGKPHSSNPRNT